MKSVGFLGFLFLLLFASGAVSAQSGRLTLHGVVENELVPVGFADIEVYKDNEVFFNGKTQRNGSFKLDLELGSVYSIAFAKNGYIDKSVAVIAKTDSTIEGRYFFQLDIELFRVDQNVLDESMLPPVAKLYIRDEDMGFRYDKKYVKWVAGQYDDIEE